MSWWSRFANVFRGDQLSREIDEELQSHVEEATERGRDLAAARRALGSPLRLREESRDVRLIVWLDSLRADAVFGWRQLMKNKVPVGAAILSLALGIGACTSAFRLIDALLFRPLPVSDPDRLYAVSFEGPNAMTAKAMTYDSCSYPMFLRMRETVRGEAELIAISYADHVDLTYGSDEETEKAYLQYVSGWMFSSFGLQPALGRLLTASDDLKPGAHPYAVLSYDYWRHRFGEDPKVIGRTFQMGGVLYEIVGVGPERFTGTETGILTDVFVPMMMKNPATLTSPDNFWLRTLVQLKPGVTPEPVDQKLLATFRAIQQERAKGFTTMPRPVLATYLKETLLLEPAAAGRSNLQRDYRSALVAFAILVALVLLIACANVANLTTAQAAARAREMALRVSIGAGRARLLQLVLVESAWIGFLAAATGLAFAWFSAPLVVGMINPSDDPVRLYLPADWRVLGFGLALALVVTLLFGLAPALRASAVQPAGALKGCENPHSRRRLMHGLIATQAAFCFVVLFIAGLFVVTFKRLSEQPLGFSPARILALETIARPAQLPVYWDQVATRLRQVPGVERIATAGWALMSGESAVGSISTNGELPTEVFSDFLSVSPGWLETMRIPLIDGSDFRNTDAYRSAPAINVDPMTPRAAEDSSGAAIVNQAFAKQYFGGADPVGRSFERVNSSGARLRLEIVGYVRDARSRDDLRLPIRPTVYIPIQAVDANGAFRPTSRATFLVKTSTSDPLALAAVLRREVPRTRPDFRVSNIRTQTEIDQSKNLRERLLARLAFFFGAVALLLAGVGLYGVLDYSVLQRRREVAIRMALGAQASEVARRVTTDVFSMVIAGAFAGLALGFASVRYVESLLYQVKPGDPRMLAFPALTILAAALLAALPPVIRAVRIDPALMLRAE
ncbi:MAG TPA: ABC transporter permease [Bryobacteraceae bacterium]